jgi:hypothetical protein
VVSDEQVDVADLNNFIASKKPPYMVPAATMQIDSIPLNQNQKVNRRALPAPVLKKGDAEYVKPVNEQEALFCGIFGDILGIEQYSATDNFFELGGTSVMVIRIITEADKAGRHIAYGDVFANPTPRQLAALLSEQPHPDTTCEGGSQKQPNDQTTNSPNADAQYDYKPIDTLLMRNTLDNFRKGERQSIRNALLTGATGYLGINLLRELIGQQRDPLSQAVLHHFIFDIPQAVAFTDHGQVKVHTVMSQKHRGMHRILRMLPVDHTPGPQDLHTLPIRTLQLLFRIIHKFWKIPPLEHLSRIGAKQ